MSRRISFIELSRLQVCTHPDKGLSAVKLKKGLSIATSFSPIHLAGHTSKGIWARFLDKFDDLTGTQRAEIPLVLVKENGSVQIL